MGYMTDGLTFNALRRANLTRLPKFRNNRGQLAHSQDDGSDWSPAQWLQAVVGELGEYANFAKKYERGDLDSGEFVQEAAKELADVVIYLDILAYQHGIDLGEAVRHKWNQTCRKLDIDMRLSVEDWHNGTPTDSDCGIESDESEPFDIEAICEKMREEDEAKALDEVNASPDPSTEEKND